MAGRSAEEFADRDFAQVDAVRLEELRLDGIEQRADRLLRLGRPVEAVTALQELLVDHPDRERGRELLMAALYRTGRHTERWPVRRLATAPRRRAGARALAHPATTRG